MKTLQTRTVPLNLTFQTRKDGDWYPITSRSIFENKRVVVFSLPGAFTPTCSTSHLPRYEELTPVFREHGIDEVVCVSVNDGFVMEAWGKDLGIRNVRLLPDGNGAFTDALGMLVDKEDLGFGKRSWRYAMVVDNGVITHTFVEPDEPGDPFKVSDADTLLQTIAPGVHLPDTATLVSKPGCPFCIRAKKLLEERGIPTEEIALGSGVSFASLRNLSGQTTAPQIFLGGRHIGGLRELEAYFSMEMKGAA